MKMKQKLYVDLEKPLHKRLRQQARREGRSMTALHRLALDAYLKRAKKGGRR